MAVASGTRGVTQLEVAEVISLAYQRASGGLISMISGEQLNTARQSLFLILTAFVNKGLSLWCVETDVLPVEIGKIVYTVPQGAIDILNMQRRSGTFTAADSILPAGATLTYTDATRVQSVEIRLPSAGTFNLRADGSVDGVDWVEAGSKTFTVAGAETVAFDLANQPTVQFWRVVELVPSVTFLSARFVSATTEVPFSQVSRDDYFNLPDRGAPGLPLQYWYDKQFDNPKFSVWQVSNLDTLQIVITTQKEIQDVGELYNILAIPSRWIGAVVSELAVKTYLVLPKVARTDIALAELREIASQDLMEAANSESDGGPVTFTPAISAYTR